MRLRAIGAKQCRPHAPSAPSEPNSVRPHAPSARSCSCAGWVQSSGGYPPRCPSSRRRVLLPPPPSHWWLEDLLWAYSGMVLSYLGIRDVSLCQFTTVPRVGLEYLAFQRVDLAPRNVLMVLCMNGRPASPSLVSTYGKNSIRKFVCSAE